MSITTKFESDNQTFTIQRPSYRAFRDIATKVSALLDVAPEVAFTAPEFEEVLKALIVETDALDAWLAEAPYDEVARLWDASIEHCEFQSFFAERRQRHSENSKEQTLREVDLQAAQFKRMQKSGMLPEDFSIESMLKEGMSQGMNPMNWPSSPTITPAGTDGDEETSKTKTSGSSSATIPKRPGGGKPSKN